MNKAILLSGGIDSIALAYWLKPNIAYTINYGQLPALAEIHSSQQVCKILNIKHEIITIDCSSLGSGDLSGNETLSIAPSSEWWPFRNQMLITLACMKGISDGIEEFMVGSVRHDSFHKDGTYEFYNKINEVIHFQEGEMKITSPAINLSSVELIKISKVPLEVLLWAHSCHKSNIPCGDCPGCFKHLAVKQDLHIDL